MFVIRREGRGVWSAIFCEQIVEGRGVCKKCFTTNPTYPTRQKNATQAHGKCRSLLILAARVCHRPEPSSAPNERPYLVVGVLVELPINSDARTIQVPQIVRERRHRQLLECVLVVPPHVSNGKLSVQL